VGLLARSRHLSLAMELPVLKGILVGGGARLPPNPRPRDADTEPSLGGSWLDACQQLFPGTVFSAVVWQVLARCFGRSIATGYFDFVLWLGGR